MRATLGGSSNTGVAREQYSEVGAFSSSTFADHVFDPVDEAAGFSVIDITDSTRILATGKITPNYSINVGSGLSSHPPKKKSCWYWTKLLFTTALVFVDVISEAVLTFTLYSKKNSLAFYTQISFTSLTLLLFWVASSFHTFYKRKAYRSRLYTLAAYLPLSSLFTLQIAEPSSTIIYVVFSAIPQYIINVSYMLKNDEVNLLNILSLVLSLASIVVSPFLAISLHWHKEKKSRLKAQQAAPPSCWDSFCMFFVMGLLYLLFIVPITLLELIHFFPILAEYFIYDNLGKGFFISYMVLFNASKLLFLGTILQVSKESVSFIISSSIRNTIESVKSRAFTGAVGQLFIFLCIVAPLITVFPLVPAFFCVYSVFVECLRHKRSMWPYYYNVGLIVVYLALSYGSMIFFFKNAGKLTVLLLQLVFALSAVLVVHIVVSVRIPCVRHQVLRLTNGADWDHQDGVWRGFHAHVAAI